MEEKIPTLKTRSPEAGRGEITTLLAATYRWEKRKRKEQVWVRMGKVCWSITGKSTSEWKK